jgi:potassium-dependent mechanosensitive channel
MISVLNRILTRFRLMSKWRLFMILLAITALIAAIFSFFTYRSVLDNTAGPPLTLAVLAPLSGPDAALGEAMVAGVAQWIESNGAAGGLAGHAVNLKPFDETLPGALDLVTADQSVVAVIGPFSSDMIPKAATALKQAGIPIITPVALPALGSGRDWILSLSADALDEVRFLANYVRNIGGEPLVSIIRPDTAEQAALATAFDGVMQRFGTRIVYQWVLNPAGGQELVDPVAAGIVQQKLAGTILVLGDPRFAAATIASLREAGVHNRIVGPRSLATRLFQNELAALWNGSESLGAVLNGIQMATPVLFDTAGIAAQGFRAAFDRQTGAAPDWLATLSHDAARLLGQALTGTQKPVATTAVELRLPIREVLLAANRPENALSGIVGAISFDERNRGGLPTLVGQYDGESIIAALTQLTPIREEGVSNYLQELVAGRALYVNDRFMYKTNVAYTGVGLQKVTDLNLNDQTVALEFLLWFRWREGFEPQDIVFANAVTPIKLEKPEREAKVGDLTYRSYRVTGTFFINFSDVERAFGTELVDISFRHRTLGRNNLMYVGDVLGMDLIRRAGSDAADEGESWLNSLLGITSDRSTLTRQLEAGNVLAGLSGWIIDRAWLSQDVSSSSSEGDPVFVGFGKPRPDFSTLSLGIVLKPDTVDIGALIPSDFLVYIAIFAAAGTVLAMLLDQRDRGQFWRIQTLLLRLVSWPALLMALGNLALNYALANATGGVVELVDLINHCLWWIIPAHLAVISMERFIWVPLEARTNRKVPDVVRMLVASVIYLLAGFGIVAFVLGETITSLLATSGLLAMIIGLAVQSNLNDIFSGIILNLERAFLIRDRIRIGETEGEVVDITWRTTKIRHGDGHLISLPNGSVAAAEIHNLSARVRAGQLEAEPGEEMADDRVDLDVAMPPDADPHMLITALTEAARIVLSDAGGEPDPVVEASYSGVELVHGAWTGHYRLHFQMPAGQDREKLVSAFWLEYWSALQSAGIGWAGDPAAGPAASLDMPQSLTLSGRS